MLAAYPKASRPITALPRTQGIVPSFAVLAATGVGAVAAVGISIASASAAMAGVGTFNPSMLAQVPAVLSVAGTSNQIFTLQGNASATFNASGLGDFQAPSIVSAFISLAAAGFGNLAGVLTAPASAALSATGTGAFAAVMTAQVSAAATFEGSGFIQAADTPGSEAIFDGVGAFSAVSYAFYGDTEMLAPRDEPRVLYVPWEDRNPVAEEILVPDELRETYAVAENRVAVVPYENRVYEVASKPRVPSPPNRRRKP
jgi:hypothetical protein